MQQVVVILGGVLILVGISFLVLPVLSQKLPVNFDSLPFVGKVSIPVPALILLLGVGLVLYPVSPWWPEQTSKRAEGVDCSQASHPAYQTELRIHILDGLRRHFSYNGIYIVRTMTKVGDWAYVEAAREDEGVDRAYVLQSDGLQWNWRWSGQIGTKPGDPELPTDFRPVARVALLCRTQ